MLDRYRGITLDNDVLFFLDNVKNNTPFYLETYEGARAELSRLQVGQNFEEDIVRQDYDFLLSNGQNIHFRILKDKELTGDLPVIFYVHGGGWIMGDMMVYDGLLRNLAKNVQANIVFVEYSLAPYARFPKPLLELFEVFEHVIKNSESFGLNKNKIIFMGDDVGANMATVLTLNAIKNGYNILSQVLCYPVLNGENRPELVEENQKGIWLEKKTLEWFFNAYEPDINKRKNPYVSPLFFSDDLLKKMPFTFLLTAEQDISNVDTNLYEEKLRKVGVDVFSIQAKGAIHDFLMLHPLLNSFNSTMMFKLIGNVLQNKILHNQ